MTGSRFDGRRRQNETVDDPDDAPVKILMSTCNGERFLDELIASLQAQTHSTWKLLCRDDASIDGTVERLRHHASHDDRIVVLPDDGHRLGAASSFMSLLAQVGDAPFAFCDQDDIWEPQKLAWSVAELRRAGAPIAGVYTDAFLCDQHGEVEGPSALARRGVRRPPTFGELLIVNAAIGATFVGTAALARAAVEAADHDPWMHDWWCALVAAYGGELRMIPYPTMRWRRHPATATAGVAGPTPLRSAARLEYLAWSARAAEALAGSDIEPHDASVARAAATLGAMTDTGPTSRGLLAADRAGVRPWPARRRIALHATVAAHRLTGRGRGPRS